MGQAPRWLELASQLAQNPSSAESRIAVKLPDLLSKGVSPLEVSRSLRESPDIVVPFLDRLAEVGVVEREKSNITAPFPNDLYYLRSDGIGFFRYLSRLSSPSASAY